ncbi:MAG: hypothetical protein L3K06_04525, partial [Thermoplasmata archaeon]|nr:hypothetical protein [Thermoplasmata archaeon]
MELTSLSSRTAPDVSGLHAARGGRRLALAAETVSALVGIASLAGWLLGSTILRRAGQADGVLVVPWTGVMLIALAVALLARTTRRGRVASWASGLVLALTATLLISPTRDGFAGLLFRHELDRAGESGRPAIWMLVIAVGLALGLAT